MKQATSFFVWVFSYLLIGIPILLNHLGGFNISFERLFAFFGIVFFLYLLFRIDSRFLILNAVLLLWMCPFLLSYGLKDLAEAVAIYVYYFLVIGVVLQLIEVKINYNQLISFKVMPKIFRKPMIFYTGLWGFMAAMSYIMHLNSYVKAISLYFLSLAILQAAMHFAMKEDRAPKGVEFF